MDKPKQTTPAKTKKIQRREILKDVYIINGLCRFVFKEKYFEAIESLSHHLYHSKEIFIEALEEATGKPLKEIIAPPDESALYPEYSPAPENIHVYFSVKELRGNTELFNNPDKKKNIAIKTKGAFSLVYERIEETIKTKAKKYDALKSLVYELIKEIGKLEATSDIEFDKHKNREVKFERKQGENTYSFEASGYYSGRYNAAYQLAESSAHKKILKLINWKGLYSKNPIVTSKLVEMYRKMDKLISDKVSMEEAAKTVIVESVRDSKGTLELFEVAYKVTLDTSSYEGILECVDYCKKLGLSDRNLTTTPGELAALYHEIKERFKEEKLEKICEDIEYKPIYQEISRLVDEGEDIKEACRIVAAKYFKEDGSILPWITLNKYYHDKYLSAIYDRIMKTLDQNKNTSPTEEDFQIVGKKLGYFSNEITKSYNKYRK